MLFSEFDSSVKIIREKLSFDSNDFQAFVGIFAFDRF